jgi:hypothetical protein
MNRAEALDLLRHLLVQWDDEAHSLDVDALLPLAFIGDESTGYLPVGETRDLQLMIGRQIVRASHVPSLVGCPTWCALPALHPFTEQDESGNLFRTHEAVTGRPPGPRAILSQPETAAGPAGPLAEGVPAVLLEIGGDLVSDPLSADECDAIAAVLAIAAQHLRALR